MVWVIIQPYSPPPLLLHHSGRNGPIGAGLAEWLALMGMVLAYMTSGRPKELLHWLAWLWGIDPRKHMALEMSSGVNTWSRPDHSPQPG